MKKIIFLLLLIALLSCPVRSDGLIDIFNAVKKIQKAYSTYLSSTTISSPEVKKNNQSNH